MTGRMADSRRRPPPSPAAAAAGNGSGRGSGSCGGRPVGHALRTIVDLMNEAARHGRSDVMRAVCSDVGGRVRRIMGMVHPSTARAMRRAGADRQ